MSLTHVEEARNNLNAAQAQLRKSAHSALRETVTKLLSHDDISSVFWGARSSEYDDEGMYPGVTGPFINVPGFDPQEGLDSISYSDRWNLVGYGNTESDPRVTELKKLLNLLGEDVLCEIFGDQSLVVGYMTVGGVEFEGESLDY